MSALTSAIAEEIENLQEDIRRTEAAGGDTTHFRSRLSELSRRLAEANEKLSNRQVLKG